MKGSCPEVFLCKNRTLSHNLATLSVETLGSIESADTVHLLLESVVALFDIEFLRLTTVISN